MVTSLFVTINLYHCVGVAAGGLSAYVWVNVVAELKKRCVCYHIRYMFFFFLITALPVILKELYWVLSVQ